MACVFIKNYHANDIPKVIVKQAGHDWILFDPAPNSTEFYSWVISQILERKTSSSFAIIHIPSLPMWKILSINLPFSMTTRPIYESSGSKIMNQTPSWNDFLKFNLLDSTPDLP